MYHNKHSVLKVAGICLLFLFYLSVSSNVYAGTDSDEKFQLGKEQYAAGKYDAAIKAFTDALRLAPDISSYHHWLGKSYGQMAEHAGIFTAYKLSQKTRQELERAVELDNSNIAALSDLMEYYQRAPVFLGGGQEKADKISNRLHELKHPEPEHI